MQTPEPGPGKRKKRVLLGSILAAVAVLVTGSALVFAHGGGGGWRHGMASEEMVEHLQVHVEHVLKEVDATPQQTAQIKGIVAATAKELQALRAQHSSARKEMHDLFTASTIDRAQLETLRAGHMQALDGASKLCATALADVAEILTPEQRAKLGEKMAKRFRG